MPASLLGLRYYGALSVRVSKGSLVFIVACSVRSTCLLYVIVVVSIEVISHTNSFPVVIERWTLDRSRLYVGKVSRIVSLFVAGASAVSSKNSPMTS